MVVDWVRGLSLLLPLGFTLFFSRIYILRKRQDKKYILIQFLILVFYWSIILALVYQDIVTQHSWNQPYIVYIWLGYYFFVEPIVAYLTLFKYYRKESISFIEYLISAVIWTFIITLIAVLILVLWYISTGLY